MTICFIFKCICDILVSKISDVASRSVKLDDVAADVATEV